MADGLFDNPRTFLTTNSLFKCPWHVLDVHGSLQGLFRRPADFFDNRRPFLIADRLFDGRRPFFDGRVAILDLYN